MQDERQLIDARRLPPLLDDRLEDPRVVGDVASLELLEQAARSRSEADWIVGMNATRAATIRLRSSFDGAVSLGRVQTPTLAIIARREEEIRAFVPEPYWLVDATFEPVGGDSGRKYAGRFHAGAQPRLKTAEEAEAIVSAVAGGSGEEITPSSARLRKMCLSRMP